MFRRDTLDKRSSGHVAADHAGLLALDAGVHAGHPGIHLEQQFAVAQFLDVVGPGPDLGG